MEDGRDHIGSSTLAILIAVATLAAGIVGCGGSGDSSTMAAGSTGSDSTTAAGPSGHDEKSSNTSACRQVKSSKAKSASYSAPEQVVKRGERLTAVVKTSCGPFEIRLNVKRFPTAVNSFVFLAEKGFYDGLGFDRASIGAYVEGGKPNGGADGPGYSVQGRVPSGFIYRHTVVAMSQSGEAAPGHAGSQFFVVVAKPWLDFGTVYAPLGTVEKGLDVLERISELGPPNKYAGTGNIGTAGKIGKLRRPVLIEGVTIEKG